VGLESNSKPTGSVDRPSYTFIGHDDDLTSKRIKDANARKKIRSHVMRDVRRRERLAGTKRVSRRESRAGQSDEAPITLEDQDSGEQTLVLRAASQSSVSSDTVETEDGDARSRHPRGRPIKWSAGHAIPYHYFPNPKCLPTSWFSDPFTVLPGASEFPVMVETLVFYWKNVFVPITFPNTDMNPQNPEIELMVRSSFSDPGSFFGLMSMCAAHRAMLNSYRSGSMGSEEKKSLILKDPDYCIMKVKSIREMNVKVRDPTKALSDEAFDTIVNLLTGSLIVGLFDEARIHLTGLKRMVELRGGILDDSIRSSTMLSAILTTDVKSASGLMTKPVFPLTWDAQPVPQEIQQRVRPPASSPLNRLGSGFFSNTLLSAPLLRILHVVRDVIFFSVACRSAPAAVHGDQDFFRVLNYETEHQLLSYVYTDGQSPDESSLNPELELHPIEAVTRVASICFLNLYLIHSPSQSGLGRALTKHLKAAVNNCKLPLVLRLPKENFGLFAWALFIGAQGSLAQVERPWFVDLLARTAMICGWKTWEQASEVLADYFFIPSRAGPASQGPDWKSIWDEAMAGLVFSETEDA
ncbi:hypothetical protein N7474_010566, partial [Penicillium riverlandense]|uniref:uncharacterized protein n=1 Tax=Penicillium riverlandense TaxID=1903569 RepID=UPI0025483A32